MPQLTVKTSALNVFSVKVSIQHLRYLDSKLELDQNFTSLNQARYWLCSTVSRYVGPLMDLHGFLFIVSMQTNLLRLQNCALCIRNKSKRTCKTAFVRLLLKALPVSIPNRNTFVTRHPTPITGIALLVLQTCCALWSLKWNVAWNVTSRF